MLGRQLELFGLEECLRRADAESATRAERLQARRRIEVAHQILTSLPSSDELAFLHAGMCQMHLPRMRPASNRSPWIKTSGRMRLVIQPGLIVPDYGDDVPATECLDDESLYCGVPYGSRARLLLIWLQSEGVKGREIRMDSSLSAWIRSLGLTVTGGPRGSIGAIREQVARIVTCNFSFQWTASDAAGTTQKIHSTRIVDGMDLWTAAGDASKWQSTIHISESFYEHLREHAVPLDQRAIAHLAGKSLALDLYTFFAHRLHRVSSPVLLTWSTLYGQFGDSGVTPSRLAQRIKECLPDIHAVYPEAKFDIVRRGVILKYSPPPITRQRLVRGSSLRLVG